MAVMLWLFIYCSQIVISANTIFAAIKISNGFKYGDF
ncbi:MAG: hypothetical protein JWQ40_4998 [Segetibacter sp.]|nr:hypothetical protein [Segetibacter sp.]